MGLQPPRPTKETRSEPETLEVSPPASNEGELVELDEGARALLSDTISRAVASELGNVRISSIPPTAPRSSIRVAADVTGKVSKWVTMTVGALALIGQVIVWVAKPEYAAPLAQALKLIASVITSLAGGGAPAGDATP
jgi:hypothetical protein